MLIKQLVEQINVISSMKGLNDQFEPVIKVTMLVTMEIPIEPLLDGFASVGTDVFYEAIGHAMIDQIVEKLD